MDESCGPTCDALSTGGYAAGNGTGGVEILISGGGEYALPLVHSFITDWRWQTKALFLVVRPTRSSRPKLCRVDVDIDFVAHDTESNTVVVAHQGTDPDNM